MDYLISIIQVDYSEFLMEWLFRKLVRKFAVI